MKNKVKKILCGFAAALVIMTGALAIFSETAEAATYGIYTVTAKPYYAHPVTGMVEDSGQNPGIGQGMTESVLDEQALLEVDEDGNHFVTARFCLMDNIEDVSLSVQEDAESAFADLEYAVMKEDMEEATSDLRFAVPDENAIVRASFYVVPMGRDVLFYITFSDPVSGSGDFVTSVEVDENIAAEQQAQSTPAPSASPTAAATPNVSTAIDIDGGLAVYENSNETKEQGDDTVVWFIIIAIAVIAAVAIVGVVYYKKKVRRNRLAGEKTDRDGGKGL